MSDNNAITFVDYTKLHLDGNNPRLPNSLDRTPKAILTWIAKFSAIEDLMNAIGTNGFFLGEPLVVYPHPTKKDNYIVIEGNRRLTAVKLLHDPYECLKPSSKIQKISAEAMYKPEDIPVVIQKNSDEALPYLGFRHITGIEEWQPLPKARYIKSLFDLIKDIDDIEKRYIRVAQTIGSRKEFIQRNLDALAVYLCIEQYEFFRIPDLDEESFKFSLFMSALGNEYIAEFTGLTHKIQNPQLSVFSETNEITVSTHPIINPNTLKKENIKDLTHWLFSKKEGKSIVSSSEQIPQLGKVVSTLSALNALKEGDSLQHAYRLTTGVNEDFKKHLYEAQSKLEQAAGMVALVDYNIVSFELALEVLNSIKLIGKALKEKRVDIDDEF